MKSNPKSKIIILITLGILFALSPIINNNLNFNGGNSDDSNLDNKNLKISAVSGKIHIDNNWTAAKAAGIVTGTGSSSDPYVIEDLVIDAGGSGSGITIENSDVYFKIENCTFYNSGNESNHEAGITLRNVSNGELINNNVNNNNAGIVIVFSNNTIISGNTANYNKWGGISIWGGLGFNVISGNIVNNTTSGSGILLWNSSSIVSHNTVYNNSQDGITLNESNRNLIIFNTISHNKEKGIDLDWDSNSNEITQNAVNSSGEYGIYIDETSTENKVYLNCFSNTLNAYDDGSNNDWDNGVKGNFWSDYLGSDINRDGIGNVPYDISGSAGSQDNYPMMKCSIPFLTRVVWPGVGSIPGYNLFFLLGILSVVVIILSKKLKNS
ncbi:hypothetical protein LCGC14_0723830 [marine sediment metagenome]|uniref:Periplasmic copper-binding protein NosD beta helix domain-containing protein n=1 Tax=marine sediment metagenome TaxID=412755 RepID=A0A0F9QWJ5_9ZZZZ